MNVELFVGLGLYCHISTAAVASTEVKIKCGSTIVLYQHVDHGWGEEGLQIGDELWVKRIAVGVAWLLLH